MKLSKRLSRDSAVDPFDVQQAKKALNRLGYYRPPDKLGITAIPDAALFDALTSFQRDHDLKPDGIMRPAGETEKILARETAVTPEGFYRWRTVGDNRVRGSHAALDGDIRSWSDSPDPGEEINCRCWAEPVELAAYLDTIDPPIEKVYPEFFILAFLRGGSLVKTAWSTWIEAGKRDSEWRLGEHKPPKKWAAQMEKRDWTPEQISKAIRYGKKHPAPNKVNKENGATRYDYDGRFIVRDDKTKEILQIGDRDFIPEELPR